MCFVLIYYFSQFWHLDLEELLHLMQDRPAGQKMVRCSKARAMFAMRACRKSVMIGTALNKTQMTSVKFYRLEPSVFTPGLTQY